jgi:predicted Holliday junction resolvase-like endonuclease
MNKKINISILVWVAFIFSLLLLNQCSNNHQLKKQIDSVSKDLRKEYEDRIKEREITIEKLRKENDKYRKEIDFMNHKIDSLNLIKGKIIIKYRDRIKEIKIMNIKSITEYWNEEFN